MLVLTRRTGERILIGENVWVAVHSVRGSVVKLAIEAPTEVPIVREELLSEATPETEDERDKKLRRGK